MLAQRMKCFASTIVLALTALTSQASAFVLAEHSTLRVSLDKGFEPVVATAFDLVCSDLQRVMDVSAQLTKDEPQVIIGSVQGSDVVALKASGVDLAPLYEEGQAFIIATNDMGQLVIAGSDDLGTAYGLMEFSRLLGVSPLVWWADVDPEQISQLQVPDGYYNHQSPYVSFRGIHVTDIEWGLQAWITRTFDPSGAYTIDQKTARNIFELLLRLRANVFWSPEDDSSRAFFASAEGKALAQAYGIYLGTDTKNAIDFPGLDQPLMCEDDGFGYLRHFPSEAERQQDRGCGVYYHANFSGGPHEYLWQGTASPFLMFQQLSEAYYHGAYRLWVLNVGDIKPCEYLLSLFTDMAWDLGAVRELSIGRHLEEFFAQTIGRDVARLISIYMKEFYHLSFQRKPEHLAGTRTEEALDGTTDWNTIHDMPWSEKRIRHRLGRYDLMRKNVLWVADSVRRTHPSRYDAYFELVEYPVITVCDQNQKFLMAQLARHGRPWLSRESVADTWRRSDLAHNHIQSLTQQYNALRNNKWQGIMSSNPAGRQVFQPVPHTQVQGSLPTDPSVIASFYGASYHASSFSGGSVLDPVLGLGASIRAMPVPKDCNVTYKFKHNYGQAKSTVVLLRVLPTHPIEAEQRFTLSLDGSEPQTYTYDTEVGTEQWKRNVLRNYAVVVARLPITQATGEHQLVVSALDDGVVIDEVFVFPASQVVMEQ